MPRKRVSRTTPHVLRLDTREDFRNPLIQTLITQALATYGKRDWSEKELVTLCSTIVNMATDPNVGMWAGYEGEVPKSFLLLMCPNSILDVPQVVHWHNEGKPLLKRLMCVQLLAFLRSRGYNSCWVVNRTGKADSTWARGLRVLGKPLPIGSIVQFEVGGESR